MNLNTVPELRPTITSDARFACFRISSGHGGNRQKETMQSSPSARLPTACKKQKVGHPGRFLSQVSATIQRHSYHVHNTKFSAKDGHQTVMRYRIPVLAVLLWYVFMVPAIPKEEPILAEGVAVAIQRGKADTRIIDPTSFADLAEIYMVRVDHWSKPRKEKYIIVEYIHRADLIGYEQFDKTRWTFEVHQGSPEETKDCLSWLARKPSLLPTAFGAKEQLPNPKKLPCFLMTKRPAPVPKTKVADGVIEKTWMRPL